MESPLPREILRIIFLEVLKNQEIKEAKKLISDISNVCISWWHEMWACLPLFFKEIGLNLINPVILQHHEKKYWRNYKYTEDEITQTTLDKINNIFSVFSNNDYIIVCDKHKLVIIDEKMLTRVFDGVSVSELQFISGGLRLYSTAKGPVICASTIFGECGVLYFDKQATLSFNSVSSLRSIFFTGNYYIYEPKVGTAIIVENIISGEKLCLNKKEYRDVLHSYGNILLVESIFADYYLFNFAEDKVIEKITGRIIYHHDRFIVTSDGILYDIHLKMKFKVSLERKQISFVYKNKLQYIIITYQ